MKSISGAMFRDSNRVHPARRINVESPANWDYYGTNGEPTIYGTGNLEYDSPKISWPQHTEPESRFKKTEPLSVR